MCRPQPGRRCPKHCRERVDAAAAVYEAVRADTSAADVAEDEMALAATDLDACGNQRADLRRRILDLDGVHDPDGSVAARRDTLLARLLAATALVAERERQAALMPPNVPPGGPSKLRAVRRALGKQRGELARIRVQMSLSGDDTARRSRWEQRHAQVHARIADLTAHYALARGSGRPNLTKLDRTETNRYQAGTGEEKHLLSAESHHRAADAAGQSERTAELIETGRHPTITSAGQPRGAAARHPGGAAKTGLIERTVRSSLLRPRRHGALGDARNVLRALESSGRSIEQFARQEGQRGGMEIGGLLMLDWFIGGGR